MTKVNKKFTFLLLIIHCLILGSLLNAQQPTEEWAVRYERPSGSSGIANQMALDKVGNCYVFGNRPVSGNFGGMVLIKYNSSGDTIWTRSYNIGAGNAAINVAVAADSIGNCYITGYIGPTFGPYDIVLIKYNPSGTQEWIKTFAGLGNVSDIPEDLRLDKYRRPCITGQSNNNPIIIKYNINGDTIWTRQYVVSGYTGITISLGFDLNNNIYTGGIRRLISTNERAFLVIKYDTLGNQLWSNTYSVSGFESASKINVDIFGNCYITGISNGWLTAKFSNNGTFIWGKEYPLGRATDVVSDVNGNCYVTGYAGPNGFSYDYVTIKYNTVGDSLWVRRYNGPGNDNDEAYANAIDDSANIYVTGRSSNTPFNWDYAVVKYDNNGVQQWVVRYLNGVAHSIALDKDKNIYVTGRSDSAGLPGYVTIKYSQFVGIVNNSNKISKQFILFQNYPNPFNPSTTIYYEIPRKSHVNVSVFNLLGEKISTLLGKVQTGGSYSINFEAINLPSGVYFYRLTTEDYSDTKKMILLK